MKQKKGLIIPARDLVGGSSYSRYYWSLFEGLSVNLSKFGHYVYMKQKKKVNKNTKQIYHIEYFYIGVRMIMFL